jgi:2-phosphosulfolactate phosphatase
VVVVDVLRAFTTSAYAFDRGADEIILVSTVNEAFKLREQDSHLLLTGEVNGFPIQGFDLPNSPSAIENLDLKNRRLVLRTTAGTQGAVLAAHAKHIYVASLSVAEATAHSIRSHNPEVVTFIETGVKSTGGGEEDIACSDYIASLLMGTPIGTDHIENRVRKSQAAAKFSGPSNSDFPKADLENACKTNQFPFSMKASITGDYMVLKTINEFSTIQ